MRLQRGSFNWDLESSISIYTTLAQALAAWSAECRVRKFLRQARHRVSRDTGTQISAEEESVTESFLSQLDQCLAEEKVREAKLEEMLAAERQKHARVKMGRQRPAEEEVVTPVVFLSELDQCLAEEKLREAELEGILATERQNCTRLHPDAADNGLTRDEE